MKVGDMVNHIWTTQRFGIIIGFKENPNCLDVALVLWKNKVNPCHVSKLEVISESR